MKTTNYRGRFRLASILPILTLSAFVTATAAKSPVAAQGEELAVWNAMAGVVGADNAAKPIKSWFFRSDFSSASFIASALDDPDREEFCGLSARESQAMVAQLKKVNAKPVLLDSDDAEAVGYRIVREKKTVTRYFAFSRVAFSPAVDSAWLSVEVNSERGYIARLDKTAEGWKLVSRCAGWYMPKQ
jgi:hypothetical protein